MTATPASSASALPVAPTNRQELALWAKEVLNLTIPDRAVCPHHQSPLDYLEASFFSREDSGPADLLVWANRGGGKTLLAAAASLLDALYHSPIALRILGGSFDQSDRLADYLRDFLAGPLHELVEGRLTRTRIRLSTPADIRMLSQSQRAVRGQHVQKIRCDEVDLFDPEVWRALQFITRSSEKSRGGIEIFSTLHCAGGLMEQLVEQARQGKAYRLFQWCLWEVIERCPPERSCSDCPLAADCHGCARDGRGFFRIDDAIAIAQRSSRSSWEAEMLCKGARRDWLVFPEFDAAMHVTNLPYEPSWPMYRAIDFGFSAPLVCLWVQVGPAGQVHVIGEYSHRRRNIANHAQEILRLDPGKVEMTFVDPAGQAQEATSGKACTEILAAHGIPTASRASLIVEGLELIRWTLAPGVGGPYLKISARCPQLIKAFGTYHYPPPGKGDSDVAVKDGPDHFIDALRYFFVNRLRPRVDMDRTQY